MITFKQYIADKQHVVETDNLRSAFLRFSDELGSLKIKGNQKKVVDQAVKIAKQSSKLSDKKLYKLAKFVLDDYLKR